jgi:haloacetate dehalogenase
VPRAENSWRNGIGAAKGFRLHFHSPFQDSSLLAEPAAIHAVCEDYRAAAGIDTRLLTAARAAGEKSTPPLLAVWGAKGTVGEDFDVVGLWKQEAVTVSGHPLPCGHLIPEEDPDGLLVSLDAFLTR